MRPECWSLRVRRRVGCGHDLPRRTVTYVGASPRSLWSGSTGSALSGAVGGRCQEPFPFFETVPDTCHSPRFLFLAPGVVELHEPAERLGQGLLTDGERGCVSAPVLEALLHSFRSRL